MERGAIAAVFCVENPDPQKLAQALDEFSAITEAARSSYVERGIGGGARPCGKS